MYIWMKLMWHAWHLWSMECLYVWMNLSNMHDIYSGGKDGNLWMKSIRLWDGNGGLVLAQGWREVRSLWDGVYLSGCTLTAEGKNMNSSILWCSQGGGHPLADLAINNILKEKTLTSYIFLATYMNHLEKSDNFLKVWAWCLINHWICDKKFQKIHTQKKRLKFQMKWKFESPKSIILGFFGGSFFPLEVPSLCGKYLDGKSNCPY